MNTIAPDNDRLRELDEDLRRAWIDYYECVQDRTGADYERAEPEAWDTLQGELRRIERRWRLLTAAASS
ncbi:MAG TPA: hypothetical protein VKV16_03105 [Solirubrobacteraceae bacterium]|nr:hypothetical protein [Solirubrobacteraceae bacterium]